MPTVKRRANGTVEIIETELIEVQPGESVFAQQAEVAAVTVIETWQQGGTYGPGDVRALNGKLWEYIGASPTTAIDPNWRPGVAWSLWRETWASGTIPTWVQPTGAHNAYRLGQEVYHEATDRIWVSQIPANTTAPGSDERYWKLRADQEPITPITQEWRTGVAYKVGDLVTYQGLTYSCRQAHTSQAGWTPPAVLALWLPV